MLRPMRMTLLHRTLAAVGLVVAVTACGADGDRNATGSLPTPTAEIPVDVDGAMVTCGGDIAWPSSAMSDHLPHEQSSHVIGALEAFAADKGPDLPPLLRDGTVDDGDWFQLAGDGHAAAIATGPWSATGPGKGAQVIYLDNTGGWKVTSWGDCDRLSPFVADAQWVRISGVTGPRDTTEPELLITESGCTGGRDPRPHLNEPTIVETADRVTVSWTSSLVDGMATCPLPPPVPATISLEAPLGDRVLYDGSSYPAREVP